MALGKRAKERQSFNGSGDHDELETRVFANLDCCFGLLGGLRRLAFL